VSDAEVITNERKLTLTRFPRLSVWADAADEEDDDWFEHFSEHGLFSGNLSRPPEIEAAAKHSNNAEQGFFSGNLSRPLDVEDGAQHNSVPEQGKSTGNLSRPPDVNNGTQHNASDTGDRKMLGPSQCFQEFLPAPLVLQQNLDIAWLQEIIAFQKQHLAPLCSQVHALTHICICNQSRPSRLLTRETATGTEEPSTCANSGSSCAAPKESRIAECLESESKSIVGILDEAVARAMATVSEVLEEKVSEIMSQAIECMPLPQVSKEHLSATSMECYSKVTPPTLAKFGEYTMSNLGILVETKCQDVIDTILPANLASISDHILKRSTTVVDIKLNAQLPCSSACPPLATVAEGEGEFINSWPCGGHRLYSSVVECQSEDPKVPGSIPTGGFGDKIGRLVQMQMLSVTTLNGETGFVLGKATNGRLAVFVPIENNILSIIQSTNPFYQQLTPFKQSANIVNQQHHTFNYQIHSSNKHIQANIYAINQRIQSINQSINKYIQATMQHIANEQYKQMQVPNIHATKKYIQSTNTFNQHTFNHSINKYILPTTYIIHSINQQI